MTREEKIAKARELRTKGLKAREIAERLDANESTVRNWYLGGDCKDCGAPIEGGSPSRSILRCSTCAATAATIWTPEAVVDRIREWAERYGNFPTAIDWNPALCATSAHADIAARFADGDWPSTTTVQEVFGSWNAAVKAAGFNPRHIGQRGRALTSLNEVAA